MKNLLFLVISALIMSGCGKEVIPTHFITSISPANGTFSTIVTISGNGFSEVAGENTVTFNGVEAVVNSATATELIVVVPEVAGTGTVNVTLNGGEVVGPVFTFEYLYTVSTFAGGQGVQAILDGTGTAARFRGPFDLDLDGEGNLIVADYTAVRKVSPSGVVSTIAGSASPGDVDGVGAGAKFESLYDLTIHPDGTYYVSLPFYSKIKKVTPAGAVTTWLGEAGAGYEDGTATAAKFNFQMDIEFDQNGNTYIADFNNHVIRKVTSAGVVSTFAGDQSVSGGADGTGSAASFITPGSMAIDKNYNLYVTDGPGSSKLRKISPQAAVTTFSGGVQGYAEGSAATAMFRSLGAMTFGHDGRMVVTDGGNNRIRLLDDQGNTSLFAGGAEGFQNGSAAASKFDSPVGIVYDADRHCYYVADAGNHLIRKIQVQ